jgi:Tfp pilus assembly protein PilV
MVELLVAMAIFSIGLLGLMSLQAATLSQGTGGRQRGTAALIAHTVLDRVQAEVAVTQQERWDSGAPTTIAGWVFIGDASGADGASAAPLKFDIKGVPLPAADPAPIFQVSWLRRGGAINLAQKTAMQEFVVNVSWSESGTTNTPVTKAISVSRYVRI